MNPRAHPVNILPPKLSDYKLPFLFRFGLYHDIEAGYKWGYIYRILWICSDIWRNIELLLLSRTG
jgi:hypothetical protein